MKIKIETAIKDMETIQKQKQKEFAQAILAGKMNDQEAQRILLSVSMAIECLENTNANCRSKNK